MVNLFLSINKKQQIGIVTLVAIIVILQVFYVKLDFSNDELLALNNTEILKLQIEVDSLKQIALAKKQPKIYPFNPNFITDYKAYKLGMSIAEFDKLKAFRNQDKWINSSKQFQTVTGVSDSLYNALKVYFKFPDWVVKRNKTSYKKRANKPLLIKDLNKATSEELQKISGIGVKLAARILKYRKKIGGFVQEKQLYEVWYLDKEVADKVLKEFKLLSKPKIIKLNINNCDVDELKKIPYLYWKSAKAIIEYRDEHAGIKKIAELKNIEGFPLDKYEQLMLYLTLK
jgi:competence ComEA-like helix-hairpin-helix protein